MDRAFDVAIIGGGAVGCAVAREISARFPDKLTVLIEKESSVAYHTSGRNSGVVHSGFHLRPGSLKARLCAKGSKMIESYAKNKRIPYLKTGKLVVCSDNEEEKIIDELIKRAERNGFTGVTVLSKHDIRLMEPYVNATTGLFSPYDGIIDSKLLVSNMVKDAKRNGLVMLFNNKVIDLDEEGGVIRIVTDKHKVYTKLLINCAGCYADEIAHKLDAGMDYTIIPFRGEYYELINGKEHIVKGLVYPVPDLNFPFLGIHFTKTVYGKVLVGPNAVLALGRESYNNKQINLSETFKMITDSRFFRLFMQKPFRKIAVEEIKTSYIKSFFTLRARKLIPSLNADWLTKGKAGIRAQLVDRYGRMVEDFVMVSKDSSVHILNTVSPGLTSCMAFAEYLIERLFEKGYL